MTVIGEQWHTLLLMVVATCHAVVLTDSLGKYNPCSAPGLATLGRGFYIGIALWPGGTIEDWRPAYDSGTQEFGLNPCNTTNDYNNTALSDANYLAEHGVVVAPFEVAVDTLMALRINASDIASLFNDISNNSTVPDVISAIVFRAGYRSEAVYIRSEDAAVSNAVGYVQTLALAATFARGQLQSLQWDDLTCNPCGGPASKQCMTTTTSQPQHSCAGVTASMIALHRWSRISDDMNSISTVAVPEADCSTEDCSLALYMGFVGDDRYSVAFQTGYQISQVNQYAVSTLYNNIVQRVTDVLSSAQTGYIGGETSPAAANGDASAA